MEEGIKARIDVERFLHGLNEYMRKHNIIIGCEGVGIPIDDMTTNQRLGYIKLDKDGYHLYDYFNS